ncbi:MAG: hypothetical protein AB1650_09785 [Candidatus Omnitrophota bacterium]
MMKILLVFNNNELKNVRVMVRLTKKRVIRQVVDLLDQEKEREVFDIVMREGEVLDYYPWGRQLDEKPVVTLIEDIL